MTKAFAIEKMEDGYSAVTLVYRGEVIISKSIGPITHKGYALDQLKILMSQELMKAE